jgi:hypothetical protein
MSRVSEVYGGGTSVTGVGEALSQPCLYESVDVHGRTHCLLYLPWL